MSAVFRVDLESCEPLWAHANCMPHSVNLLGIQPTTRCPWEHSLTCWAIIIHHLYLEHRSETEHICHVWKRAVWVRRSNWSCAWCWYFAQTPNMIEVDTSEQRSSTHRIHFHAFVITSISCISNTNKVYWMEKYRPGLICRTTELLLYNWQILRGNHGWP